MNELAKLLLSGAQGASNAAASTVSGPVDLISWTLRQAGIPIPQNAVGGSNWFAQQGLTREPENKLAGLLGEGLGAAMPAVVAAKAPQIAGGLLKGAENLAATRTASKEMGGVLNPFREGNYRVDDLSTYTPNVFRETNIDGANAFSKNSGSQPVDLWFANQPEYALGQGANRGVLLEFDAKNMPGQLSLAKPNARQAYDSGYAEFVTRDIDPRDLADKVMSVVVKPEQQTGPYFRRLLTDLKQRGFTSETLPDKSIKLTKQ